MIALLAASVGAWAKSSTPQGWTDDYDAALAKAKAENKYVIADFSGSDWCGWCKRLDREVFDTEVFRQGAADKYILLMIDSPRDKELLSEKAKDRNPDLVKKYNVNGFPTVLVLDGDGKVVFKTGYREGGPEKYLRMLDLELMNRPDKEKYIKPIEKALAKYDDEINAEMKREMHKAMDEVRARVLRKYIPLCEGLLEEARAMEVPPHMEEAKEELIRKNEVAISRMKKAAVGKRGTDN